MKIRPLNDRVLVTREEEEQKSVGGIIIPDTAKEKPQRGIVIAIGTHDELVASADPYQELVEVWQRGLA